MASGHLNHHNHHQLPPPGQGGGYQSFTDIGDPSQNPHLFIHVASGNKIVRPWQTFISDLDDFFERLYQYFRRSGFFCILVEHLLELVEIFLVILLTFFFLHGVDYDILFKNKSPNTELFNQTQKVTIADCLIPLSQASVGPFEIIMLIFASVFWLVKFCQTAISVMDNWAIRAFFIEVLQIHDPSMYSWQEVQTRLVRNQSHCLIREGHLDELSVHNRLLRRTNYMIALINKGVLPIYFKLPLMGETIYLTKGLEVNFEFLLFRGIFSLFEKNWKLRDEVKSPADRLDCARRFATRCTVLGIANILLLPFIFAWQALYAFYTYVETIKRDPSFASARTWSRYGRWFCRHFNELEHELDQRLNRAHRPATRYMNSFLSPLLALIARFFTFVAGTLFSVLFVLTVYDEDVITVEHLLTVFTGLGAIIAVSRAFLPDSEPNRWTAAELDAAVIQHIHYRPHGYPAHTLQARNGMGNIFVYKSTTIVEELLSPLVTPYILIRHMRSRALEIIDFFRVYTLELADIGDVCSFSQFNFQQNGHRIFTDPLTASARGTGEAGLSPTTSSAITGHHKAEVLPDERLTTRNGKLELSLVHFKLMNPSWQPADNGQAQFIDRFTRQSKDDPAFPVLPSMAAVGNNIAPAINEASAMANSQSTIDYALGGHSEGALGGGGMNGLALDQPPPALQSLLRTSHHHQPAGMQPSSSQHYQHASSLHGSVDRSTGGRHQLADTEALGFNATRRRLLQRRMNSMFSEAEERETDMSLSSLYFHQMVADSVGGEEVAGGNGGGNFPHGASVSFTAPAEGGGLSSTSQRQSQSRHREQQRPISESIPLLHPSSQEPRP